MNCLIYLRVSTKEQAEEGYSIPAQKEACSKFVKDKGWTLIDEYTDRGESAKSTDRPQLQEMLQRIREDKSINAIVVHKLDRLARNLEDHAIIRALLRKSDIKLISVTENIEDSASGRLVEGILATIAEFYSLNLASEIKKGMHQKVKEGGWPHSAPVGYKNVRDEKGVAYIVPDAEMAPLVKEAFNLYASGDYSITRLQQVMVKKGLKARSNRNSITRSKLCEMLQNKFYLGILT